MAIAVLLGLARRRSLILHIPGDCTHDALLGVLQQLALLHDCVKDVHPRQDERQQACNLRREKARLFMRDIGTGYGG